ncbi:MAG: choice-of-anchor D domain-containing protein, partial [Myxococcota bacterium]|nr:choice-of-anchor D domain-containing protein [Myxococcota bacterium]
MARQSVFVLLVGITQWGCSDYDLHRPDKDNSKPTPEDTAEEVEPEEDPDIKVTPDSLDFGSVQKDCPGEDLTVTISNVGLADLEVTDISFGAGDGSGDFSHEGTPVVLAYGESTTFDVSFLPTYWIDYEIDLDITSNDPDEGVVTVPTLGTGAEDSTFEEGFTQGVYEDLDILWVVDNSCSMEDEIDKVADNF